MTSRNFAYTESISCYFVKWGFPGGLALKNLPAMQETRVQFLGQEDLPLEKERAIHSSILAGKSHGKRSLAGYSPWGHRVRHALLTNNMSQTTIYIKGKKWHQAKYRTASFHFSIM